MLGAVQVDHLTTDQRPAMIEPLMEIHDAMP
jgi:hypothetical protein